MFSRILLTAVLAGLAAGLFVSAVQAVRAVPLILAAEVYEQAAPAAAEHQHDEDAWAPEDGWERTAYTALFNLLAAIGFGLLLAAGMAIAGHDGWRAGLAWGVAGYLTFVLAPALGLPPELPGSEAAPLLARQLWWVATAAATATGLGLILLNRRLPWIVAGIALIALPHLIGAPQPAEHGGVVPAALAREFVLVALATGLVFWSALGALTGIVSRRFAAAS
jgi:cobalt transporter subunit CbtA